MFWWLIGANDDVKNPPLVIWLQGGPGGSSTGFGNFEEIGPTTTDGSERKEPWTKVVLIYNILNRLIYYLLIIQLVLVIVMLMKLNILQKIIKKLVMIQLL